MSDCEKIFIGRNSPYDELSAYENRNSPYDELSAYENRNSPYDELCVSDLIPENAITSQADEILTSQDGTILIYA